MDVRSPVTVAGAAAVFHRVPIESLAGTLRVARIIRVAGDLFDGGGSGGLWVGFCGDGATLSPADGILEADGIFGREFLERVL